MKASTQNIIENLTVRYPALKGCKADLLHAIELLIILSHRVAINHHKPPTACTGYLSCFTSMLHDIVIYCNPVRKYELVKALEQLDGKVVQTSFTEAGTQAWKLCCANTKSGALSLE